MNTEKAFRFGRAQHLIGIAGLPQSEPGTVGVIVLNAGMVHRIGPFRLHVDLTRRLNAAGYPTLRFDLSTLGDSGSSGESQTKVQQVNADVGDAMRLLDEQAGCKRFVLVGLCSGAQNVHSVACTDTHVAGAVFLDGYAYRTFGYRLRHYLPRLFDLKRWRHALTRARPAAAPRAASEPVFAVAPSPRDVVRADLAGMVERGQRMCLIYTGGISHFFNHARQFRECFGSVMNHPFVSTQFLREVDHTYILSGDRSRLIEGIERWVAHHFPVMTDKRV
ncbi:MAG TPA: alpha/beta fold hydrolase [Dyella sp.]|uniref:alpha/beta fold hydrolase n=1 Tax=Dyella sp. TaxID=1869338 RepID=UPI002F91CB29